MVGPLLERLRVLAPLPTRDAVVVRPRAIAPLLEPARLDVERREDVVVRREPLVDRDGFLRLVDRMPEEPRFDAVLRRLDSVERDVLRRVPPVVRDERVPPARDVLRRIVDVRVLRRALLDDRVRGRRVVLLLPPERRVPARADFVSPARDRCLFTMRAATSFWRPR